MRKLVAKKFAFYVNRLVGAFLACAFWMLQGDFRLLTLAHVATAFRTALISSSVLFILSFTRVDRLNRNPFAGLALTAVVVAGADRIIHRSHFGGDSTEALVTGATAAALSYLIGLLRLAWRERRRA